MQELVTTINSLTDSIRLLIHSNQKPILYPLFQTLLGGFLSASSGFLLFFYTNYKTKKSKVRENALIVYYDILFGLSDIKKLLIYTKQSNLEIPPFRMYFSPEWIKNVAVISEKIEKDICISKLYKLYGDLETIRKYLELERIDHIKSAYLKKNLATLGEETFNKSIFNDLQDCGFNYKLDLNDDYKRMIDILARLAKVDEKLAL